MSESVTCDLHGPQLEFGPGWKKTLLWRGMEFYKNALFCLVWLSCFDPLLVYRSHAKGSSDIIPVTSTPPSATSPTPTAPQKNSSLSLCLFLSIYILHLTPPQFILTTFNTQTLPLITIIMSQTVEFIFFQLKSSVKPEDPTTNEESRQLLDILQATKQQSGHHSSAWGRTVEDQNVVAWVIGT